MHSQQQENVQNIQVEGWSLWRACRMQDITDKSCCESTVFFLQHINTGISPYRQNLLKCYRLFKLISLSVSSMCMATLPHPKIFLFFQFNVHQLLKTSSSSFQTFSFYIVKWAYSDIFRTFYLRAAGKSYRNIRAQLTQTFVFSHRAPLKDFEKMSRLQCMSESSLQVCSNEGNILHCFPK